MFDNVDLLEMSEVWKRFSEYEYGDAPDFSKIILPKEGAELIEYDVFSNVTGLVVDYLNLGKLVWNNNEAASIDGALAFSNRYGLLRLSEDRAYFEYAAEIMTKSKKLYDIFYNLNRFFYNNESVNPKVVENFETSVLKIGFILKAGKPKLVVKAESLQQIIESLFINLICKKDVRLRLCKHCQNTFYAKHLRAEFCAPQCRNQFNVYKSRIKNSELDAGI